MCHPLTPNILTLSLHDALPISWCIPPKGKCRGPVSVPRPGWPAGRREHGYAGLSAAHWEGVHSEDRRDSPLWGGSDCSEPVDRKSTRLNSSHVAISYAVFCLKK